MHMTVRHTQNPARNGPPQLTQPTRPLEPGLYTGNRQVRSSCAFEDASGKMQAKAPPAARSRRPFRVHVIKQCVQPDLEADRRVANTLAGQIIGGSLVSMGIGTSKGAG